MKLKDMHKSFAQIPGRVLARGVGVVGESLQAQGGIRSIHDGGPTYFFGLKIYTLGIFLGQKICHVFF